MMMNKMMNCCGCCPCCMCCEEAEQEKMMMGDHAVSARLGIVDMLHDALESIIQIRIDAIAEDLAGKDYAVLILDETGDDEVMGRQECEEMYDDFCFDDTALEDDFGFLIAYDSDHLIEIGGSWYLVDAPLLIFEIDEDGNECSIDSGTVMTSRRFLRENMVELTLEGETYTAYRLNI